MVTRNIQYRYQVNTQYGVFSDALYFPEDNPWTQEQIDAEIQQRVANFIYSIENPVEPTPEEIPVEDQMTALEQQMWDLECKLLALGEQVG